MIWECPECKDEASGPRKPAASNPCRLCPACTLLRGRFVRRKLRGPGRRAKPNPGPRFTWEGMDLQAELARLSEFCPPEIQERPITLVLKHVPKAPRTLAWARFVQREIELILWPACPLGFALAGLVHELAHFAVPGAMHSDDHFRMAMVELVRDGYGVEPPMPKGRRCAQLDHAIEDCLVAWAKDRKDKAK